MVEFVRYTPTEFKEYYIQMQAAKRSQAPLPSEVTTTFRLFVLSLHLCVNFIKLVQCTSFGGITNWLNDFTVLQNYGPSLITEVQLLAWTEISNNPGMANKQASQNGSLKLLTEVQI